MEQAGDDESSFNKLCKIAPGKFLCIIIGNGFAVPKAIAIAFSYLMHVKLQ